MISGILVLLFLALVFALLLGYAAAKFKVDDNPLVEQIDHILPQTQCGQCGFPGCRPYAEAIASGEADINRCPPGGQETVDKLAELLGVETKPLAVEEEDDHAQDLVAYIHEEECIGCMKCIRACPVDAIIGTTKMMHTVITDECTGCKLCVEPCPVDCIEMVPRPQDPRTFVPEKPHSLVEHPHA